MTTALVTHEAADRVLVVNEQAHEARESVRRALADTSPDLVGRVRARIQAYQVAPQALILTRGSFAHIIEDFTEREVLRVVELLVDLGELHPDVGVYGPAWPVHDRARPPFDATKAR